MAQREAVFPANRQDLYEKYGYSAAVRSGDLLFVSGQVGSRPDGSPEPDFEAQVRLAFANLEATLAAGGCTLADIVDLTTFHTDPEKQFGVYRTVKREKFPESPISERDRRWSQLACRLRLRDQGHRAHSISSVGVGEPPQP